MILRYETNDLIKKASCIIKNYDIVLEVGEDFGKMCASISMKIVKANYDGRNWIRAIGHYHSYTPQFFNRYVKLAVVHLKRELKNV